MPDGKKKASRNVKVGIHPNKTIKAPAIKRMKVLQTMPEKTGNNNTTKMSNRGASPRRLYATIVDKTNTKLQRNVDSIDRREWAQDRNITKVVSNYNANAVNSAYEFAAKQYEIQKQLGIYSPLDNLGVSDMLYHLPNPKIGI